MIDYFDDLINLENQNDNEPIQYLTNLIFDNVHAFVFIFDYNKGFPVCINKYYETRMGYTLNDLSNITRNQFLALFHPESLKLFLSRMVNYHLFTSEDRKTIYKFKKKDETWIKMMISTSVLKRTPEGKIKYLIGYGVELNEDEDEDEESSDKLNVLEVKSTNLLRLEKLSKREVEIITYIGNCFTDKEIAEELNISLNTTKTHRKKIIHKLEMKNTASLVKFAVESGLV
jgi:DNA-binding CsgD family transcriptional regulator